MLTCVAEARGVEEVLVAAQDDSQGTAQLELGHRFGPTGEAIVNLDGELDLASAEAAVCYVKDVIDRHRGPVTVDLAALVFCDARGLAAQPLIVRRRPCLSSAQFKWECCLRPRRCSLMPGSAGSQDQVSLESREAQRTVRRAGS